MKTINVSALNEDQKRAVRRLWNNEYPHQLTYQNEVKFESYLKQLINPSHHLYFPEHGLGAWLAVFERNDERWFAMIIDAKYQRQGVGRELLRTVKSREAELNGWVIDHDRDIKLDGSSYISTIEFYVKNDFQVLSDTRLELENISAVKINWKK